MNVKIIIISLLLFVSSVLGITKKEFIIKYKSSDTKMSKSVITLTQEDKKIFSKDASYHTLANNYPFILTRNSNGKLIDAFCFVNVMHKKFSEYHNLGVALNGDGSIKAVELIGVHGKYGAMLQTKSFQSQFSNKKVGKLHFGKDINGVTGATESAEVVVEAVNVIAAIFLEKILK